MKKKRIVKFIVSMIVFLSIIIGTVSASAVAAADIFKDDYIPSKIVNEVKEMREASSKTFLCEDGSYMAVTYAEPIHFKEDDEWREIDNTLVLKNKEIYVPKSSAINLELPYNLAKNNISVKTEKAGLAFGLSKSNKKLNNNAFAKKVSIDELTSNRIYGRNKQTENYENAGDSKVAETEKYNSEFTTIKNQKSAVVYDNVFPDIDIEYIVSSNSLKENIIINKPKDEYIYTYTISTDLTPVNNDDGSISFINDNEECIFSFSAPYMYDMTRAESTAINISIKKENVGYLLTLTADTNWINDKNRSFPVIIDPTITIDSSSIDDVFVENGVFANQTRTNAELRVGRNLTNITRTYIKTTLPSNIPFGSIITSAKLYLYIDYYYQAPAQDDINVVVYDCSSRTTWQSSSITWNNQPFSNSANGYASANNCRHSVANISAMAYSFELSTLAQKWLDTGVNKGIMLASTDEESITQIDFHSTRSNSSDFLPKMKITYNKSGVFPSLWNVNTSAPRTQSFKVISKYDWTAISNFSWISIVNTSTGFEASVNRNLDANSRQGTVIIESRNHIIGTLTINQYGVGNIFEITGDSNVITDSDGCSKSFNINSNVQWSITKPSWISVSCTSGSASQTINYTIRESTSCNDRTGEIKISGNNTDYIINVKQLGKVSSMFNSINTSNTESCKKNSAEYNNPLATWCMKLSYYSYNPLTFPANVGISAFVNTTRTVGEEMTSLGFSYKEYNTGITDGFQHTIAHRTITTGIDEEKTLVVVVIRGSETFEDIINDLLQEFSTDNTRFGFSIGADIVMTSLLGVNYSNDNNENCTNCNGTGCNYCDGYLSHYNIENPIIVITGHSLGAAVANLVTHRLNNINCLQESDIFGYTFGTPYVKYSTTTRPTEDNNLFNILNSNDIVTFVPIALDIGTYEQGEWFRYGKDLRFTMPYLPYILKSLSIEYLGIGGHIMRVYENWMDTLPDRLQKSSKNITLTDIEVYTEPDTAVGLLPKLAPKVIKIFCPVNVTIIDSNNNVLAYEGIDNVVHDDTEETYGIISWTNDNNEKYFYIPYDYQDVTVNIEAYDYGTMDFSIETLGLDDSLSQKKYENVVLYPEKEFIAEVTTNEETESINLHLIEDGQISENEIETNPMLKGVSVTLIPENDRPYQVVYTCDASVEKIRIQKRGSTVKVTYNVPTQLYRVTYIDDNTYMFLYTYLYPSDFVEYDVSVYSNGDWYSYENVFALSPQAS